MDFRDALTIVTAELTPPALELHRGRRDHAPRHPRRPSRRRRLRRGPHPHHPRRRHRPRRLRDHRTGQPRCRRGRRHHHRPARSDRGAHRADRVGGRRTRFRHAHRGPRRRRRDGSRHGDPRPGPGGHRLHGPAGGPAAPPRVRAAPRPGRRPRLGGLTACPTAQQRARSPVSPPPRESGPLPRVHHRPPVAHPRYHQTMDTGNEPPVPAEPEPAGRPAAPHDRRRNPRGNFERSIDTVHRDAQAAELRAQRWTYQKIAEHLGYSDKGQAWRGVQAAKADVARPAVTKLIQAESEQLDDLYVMALEILDHNHVTVSHGKVVTWLNPETEREEPLPDDGPKLSAIQTALRIRESYRKLHGLDQPAQVAVSGAVRYEVVGVSPEDLT